MFDKSFVNVANIKWISDVVEIVLIIYICMQVQE